MHHFFKTITRKNNRVDYAIDDDKVCDVLVPKDGKKTLQSLKVSKKTGQIVWKCSKIWYFVL